MDSLTKKTILTKRGFTYTYYVWPAAEGKPTLLLQHGFPDEAALWEDLITSHLKPAGYGVIAPDQLGYAGTSKPVDPAAYKMSGITGDLVEIIDAEGLATVISLGHDWGSRCAQVLYNLHPARVSGLAMINVAYTPTSRAAFDLDAVLAQTEKVFGYALFWYWKFFTADDGARVCTENADVLFDVLHAPQSWRQTFCTEGGMRKALETRGGGGLDLTRRPYATEEKKKAFVERMQRDGFEGPTCWYKSTVFGHQDGDANPDNNIVQVPALFVGYDNDVVCRKENIFPCIEAGLLPHLTNVTLEGAHWGLCEKPKAFGDAITEWLGKSF